jgi:hypothetical protein
LFPTKKDLFLAAAERNLRDTLNFLREAAGGKTGSAALEAMGHAYQDNLVSNREWLLMQLQTYAACYDSDIQRRTKQAVQDIWDEIGKLSGGISLESQATFFAMGMFFNVIAAVGKIDGTDAEWVHILEVLKDCKQPL